MRKDFDAKFPDIKAAQQDSVLLEIVYHFKKQKQLARFYGEDWDENEALQAGRLMPIYRDIVQSLCVEFSDNPMELDVYLDRLAHLVFTNKLSDLFLDAVIEAQDLLRETFPEIEHQREGHMLHLLPA